MLSAEKTSNLVFVVMHFLNGGFIPCI